MRTPESFPSLVIGPGVVEWVAKRTQEFGNYGAAVGIGVARQGELIAGVVYNEWNGANCNLHVAAVPGSRWLSRSLLNTLFDYPFNQLKVRRVTALVGEGNGSSRKLVEGVGFSLEAALDDAHPTGKLLVYKMTPSTCRWIRMRDELKAA